MQVFILVFALALGLTLWGRGRFQKIYRQERTQTLARSLTGAELARGVLRYRGIADVEVAKAHGLFADYYHPLKRRITLSPKHFRGEDFSSLAIAALQAGKAIQHHEKHRPLWWRNSAIRATVFLSLPLALAAALTAVAGFGKTLFPLMLLFWSVVAFWNVITIPTEIDAGERVKKQLEGMKVFRNLDERVGVERVIGAACTFYIDGILNVLSWLGSLVGLGLFGKEK
ncbi:MAG: zinc metallopeptidase [Verrucomicrobiota bacterium]